ncbi:hypothetical protein CQE29_25395 [Salmonella enterica subsp. enterica serovar Typhimurium]|nr:hypothetical protein [Salmonella enterica subsp. enterica serovar Typhimurium]
MMNPVPWFQMTNMISYQGLVRTFPNSLWRITKMVIWSLQVAIRGTVSLTAYKTQLKNARHRLNEAPRRRILQMVQPLS